MRKVGRNDYRLHDDKANKMRYLLLALLALVGCQATVPVDQKPQDPVIIGTEVPVIVREKCKVDMPVEPTWQVEAVPAASTTPFEKSKALLAEVEQRRDYLNQVKAAVKKCE